MSNSELIPPYPKQIEDVTAETVARGLAARLYLAQAEYRESGTGFNHDVLSSRYGLVYLMRALIKHVPEQADAVVRDLWADWGATTYMVKDIKQWLAEWDVDAAAIDAAANRRGRPTTPTSREATT